MELPNFTVTNTISTGDKVGSVKANEYDIKWQIKDNNFFCVVNNELTKDTHMMISMKEHLENIRKIGLLTGMLEGILYWDIDDELKDRIKSHLNK